MFANRRFAQTICCIAALGIIGSPILGAQPALTPTKQKIFDVKMTDDNQLIGQVVTSTGQPEANARIIVSQRKSNFRAQSKTDTMGRFKFKMERSGVYHVLVGKRSFTIRAWQSKIAPPTAKTGLLCVTGETVRGQVLGSGPRSTFASIMTNPFVVGGVIASAIVIPIAVEDDDDEPGGGAGGAGEPAS